MMKSVSSTWGVTLAMTVEPMLKERVPGVKSVVAA